MRAEALRYKGRLMFFRGRFNEGRGAYEQALNELRTVSNWGINGMRAYLESDWAVAEVTFGECSLSEARIQKFIEYVSQPQIPPPTRAGLIATLKTQLGQQSRCATPLALTVLN
jgi:hypothetical protein